MVRDVAPDARPSCAQGFEKGTVERGEPSWRNFTDDELYEGLEYLKPCFRWAANRAQPF